MIQKLGKEYKIGIYGVIFKFLIVELLTQNTGYDVTNESWIW